ncbi:hypothetical protein GDO86_013060, partial [Hymenochirus boettgeri]
CVCLHGGTCIYSKVNQRTFFCQCSKGFVGTKCEIDTRAKCYKDRGYDYRGTASKTTDGSSCLPWNSRLLSQNMFTAKRIGALELGLGENNFCRNPDRTSKPWCYIKKGLKIVSMACKIPKCEEEKQTGSTCGQRQHKMYKIVRGSSTSVESHPWVATIFVVNRRYKQDRFLCGGSLIHPCWVLTAAHCFPDSEFLEPENYVLNLGKSNLYEANEHSEQKFQVKKVIRHEQYNDETTALDNDIALVRIQSTSGQCATLTDYVNTACLPSAELKLNFGTRCEIAGFGKEAYNDLHFSDRLLSGSVQLIQENLCQSHQYYGKLINNNMFCAGDPEWKTDACKGDSGGPLTCKHNGRMTLYGIISWGEECAKENKPGVYTRISNYLAWIEENMVKGQNVQSNIIPK